MLTTILAQTYDDKLANAGQIKTTIRVLHVSSEAAAATRWMLAFPASARLDSLPLNAET